MTDTTSPYKLPNTIPVIKKKSGEEVRAVRWNTPDTEGKPKLWTDWTDDQYLGGLVFPVNYQDLYILLGSSGCSATKPWWTCSVIGLILSDHGKLTVNPGDWIIQDSVGCIAVYTHEQACQLLESVQ